MTSFRTLIHEIHRRSLWQVLGVYALASWFIYQVVVALWEGIGLPSWVPGTALVLLLIGLPIVLATAFVQEGAPGLRPDDRRGTVEGLETTADALAASRRAGDQAGLAAAEAGEDPSSGGATAATNSTTTAGRKPRSASTFFTWRKAVTGGVLAFALLGLAASGFMGMRALGIGPAATLISSGQLEERDVVVLADFTSLSGDSVLALTVTEGLRVGLEQSTAVRLAGPDAIETALRQMRREPTRRLDATTARELAQRQGIKAVVDGEVSEVGGTFALTARVVSATTGEPIVTVRRVARDSSELIDAIDALATRLRTRAGESLRDVRASPPLTRATTTSLDALQNYAQGLQAWYREGDRTRARLLFEEAIARDSMFAMAWRAWGIMHFGRDREKNIEGLTRAYELADRLPDRERYHVLGVYYSDVLRDYERAVDVYETVLRLHPNDGRALSNLAREHLMHGRMEEAAELYERRLEVAAGNALTFGQLGLTYAYLGAWRRFEANLDDFTAELPDHPGVLRHRAALAFLRNDFEAVAAVADSSSHHAIQPSGALRAHGLRSGLAGRRGRLADSRAHLDRYLSAQLERGAGSAYLIGEARSATLRLLVLGDTVGAVRTLEAAMRTQPLREIPLLDRPYLQLAQAYALAGQEQRARGLLEEARDSLPRPWMTRRELQEDHIDGLVALHEGRIDAGLASLHRMAERLGCGDCLGVELARGYEIAGRHDEALDLYLRGLEHGLVRSGMNISATPSTLALASVHERVAELLEERERTPEAIQHYAAVVDLWADADPELQPRVEAARRALARLTSEGGP